MSLLNPNTLKADYDPALTAMKTWWENFNEYERLARNKPHPKVIAAKLPTVTDGTLAGVINRQPKRIIQQIPTGRVKSPEEPDLADIADYIWQNEVIPHVSYNGDMIQKSWIMAKKALTYGCSVSFSFFKNAGDYFGADFSIPYIRDIIFERGQSYGPDCNVLYFRQYYTPSQIQLIIDKERRLSRKAKARQKNDPSEEGYDASWNVNRLKYLKDKLAAKEKEADSRTPAERDKSPSGGLIEIIHALQTGVGAKFYSFSPDMVDGKNVVRTKVNPDPRGKMPVDFLYADIDLSNPLGVGYCEMSGGMQNMLDSEVQSYQLIQKLMLNPPVMKWGKGIKGSTIKYKNNAVWDMGNDTGSKIEVVDINNEAIANFSTNYGLMKSQILQLTNNQDSSVPGAATGGVGQSKTPAGVNQQQQMIGFDDNYFRKQYESWYQANSETLLNIHFAESDGTREIELTEDFLDDIAPNIQDGNKFVSINKNTKKAAVMYSEIKTKLKFTVDPTTSESDDDSHQVEVLKEVLADAAQNPYTYYYMLNDGYELHLGEAYYDLFQRLGSANIKKIVTKLPRDPKTGQPTSSSGVPPAMNPMFDKPTIRVDYRDVEDPASRAAILTNAGAPPSQNGAGMLPMSPSVAEAAAKGTDTLAPAQAEGGQQPADPNAAQPADAGAAQAPATPQTDPNAQAAPDQAAEPAAAALRAGDKALAVQFLKAGYSSQQALYAITLVKRGYQHDQVMQAIGPPKGAPVNG
jgi:hypothetical protein